MNPNYGHPPQQPYQYYQNNSGPPQPQWQAPPPAPYRMGWQDPRAHTPSPSAYQTQSGPYNPNTYGPMPTSLHGQPNMAPVQYQHPYQAPHYNADTSSLGVNYNQQHYDHQSAPPLPPRPSSSNGGQVDISARPGQAVAPVSSQGQTNKLVSETSDAQSGRSWRESFYAQALSEDAIPGPPPPPRPAEYQTPPPVSPPVPPPVQYSSSEWSQEQYSTKPSTHHYEPAAQQHWTDNSTSSHSGGQQQPSRASSQAGWNLPQVDEPGLVSPDEKQHRRWTSSTSGNSLPQQPPNIATDHYQNQGSFTNYNATLVPEIHNDQVNATFSQGFGRPSDWERFTPTELQSAGSNLPPELSSAPMGISYQGQTPATQDSNTSIRPSENRYLPAMSSPTHRMAHALSTPDLSSPGPNHSRVVANELPNEMGHSNNDGNISPRQATPSLTHGPITLPRSGTIDSVIQAWNAPVQSHVLPLKVSTPPPPADDRLGSPPSKIKSPGRMRKSPEILHRRSQEAIPSTTLADPYRDVDPEYHSSLTRYLKMLSTESAAQSEKEKYKIFENFMKKELRIRQALYGIDPENPSSKTPTQAKRIPAMPTVEEADAAKPASELALSKTLSQVKRKALRSGSASSIKPSDAEPEDPVAAPTQSDTDASEVPFNTSNASEAAGGPPLSGSAPQSKFAGPAPVLSTGIDVKARPAPAEKVPSSSKLAKILTSASALPNVDAGTKRASDNRQTNTSTPSISHESFDKDKNGSTPPRSDSPQVVNSITPASIDDSYVVVGQDDGEDAYSPGGRPRLFKPKTPMANPQRSSPRASKQAKGSTPVIAHRAPEDPASPGSNAPMVIEDYAVRDSSSPGAFAPIAVDTLDKAPKPATSSGRPLSLSGPVKFEPPRPVYTPFRYNENSPMDVPTALPDRPADEAYSKLRNQVAQSGRLLAPDMPAASLSAGTPPITSPTRREHEETFLGLIRRQSKAMRKGSPIPGPAQLRIGTPLNAVVENPVSDAVSVLRASLPSSVPHNVQLHGKIVAINSEADLFPDDFGYIKETVVTWDRKNKGVRKALIEERDKRQADSEAYIDELFNSNEISYADIRTMELDFKLAEAERKYQEDQEELQSFIDSVYTPINERIQHEILQLTSEYFLAIDILDHEGEAGSRVLMTHGDLVQMAASMDLVLRLFRKLEMRYQKLAEARFERERRRKTLELGVLYTNGNTAGMKVLEQDFTAAEKLQVLDEAREKDRRANKLMDTFDKATVRCLGDNQTYVDDILSKIRKLRDVILKDDRQSNDGLYEADGARETLSTAQEALDFVLADSRTILNTSNAADNLLNEADYKMSVSKARVSNADEVMFKKLQEDREKEDAKILEEMVVRMDSMAKGPAKATILIQEIVAKIGDDPEHQERIKRALEEAKKRNAVKDT